MFNKLLKKNKDIAQEIRRHRYGLKIYSTNVGLLKKARHLIENKTFDFIEVNVISDMQPEIYNELDGLPLTVHIAFPRYHIVSTSNGMLYENMIQESPEEVSKKARLCFDFEKAVKAAKTMNMPWQEYLMFALVQNQANLERNYYHISGCFTDTIDDEHLNLWEGNLPIGFIKKLIPGGSFVVFETPKEDNSLENDIKNLEYFKKA